MSQHNIITFTAEYCKARKIPYSIKGNALFIDGVRVSPDLWLFTYRDILSYIDSLVEYGEDTDFRCMKEVQ